MGDDIALDFDMLINKAPHTNTITPWHQDAAYWIDMPDKRAASCWVAIDHAYKENGCMWYTPKSHLSPVLPHSQTGDKGALKCEGSENNSVCIELQPGSCVFHQGGTLHYSRGNSTENNRRAFITNFRPKAMIDLEPLFHLSVFAQKEEKKEEIKPIPKAQSFVTTHQGVFGGKTINYKATAKETYLVNKKGDSIASFWSVAYTKNPTGDVSKRPVTFVFNGGPGSASMWLHMGFFGPKVVKVDSDAKQDDGAAPYNLSISWKGKGKDFYGLKEDVNSFAQFIRKWVTENERWFSPKYLAGESYGTTRAAYLGKARGIIKKQDRAKTLEEFVEECRTFTYETYTPALYKGNLLSNTEKDAIADKLVYFTGLDKKYILHSNIRILMGRFQKKLLEEEGLSVGRLDGRFMGDEIDKVSERPHLGDPASYQISAAYTASLNHYFASDPKN
ncbi:Phytanoyl-CoA dioxygenase domain-containing protein 1 [Nymphon striatum]|nr:Phytanoyl-CoA dioxygenase domain-containing protein 1 [Nymphon striatum]